MSVERLAGFQQVGNVSDLEVTTDPGSQVELFVEEVFEGECGCLHFQGRGPPVSKT